MTEPLTIGIGATKWVKDSNTKMITLAKPSTNAAAAESLHLAGVDYQVPVGKKFIILQVQFGGGFASSQSGASQSFQYTGNLMTNGTTDTHVGGITVLQTNGGNTRMYVGGTPGQGASAQGSNMIADTYIEVAAGNFIIGYGSSSVAINCTGVETNV
jgi:hypothetical protein